MALDLYYDPVVDEHVGHGSMGIMAPAWYFAPQRHQVAEAGWKIAASFSGLTVEGPVTGLDNPAGAAMLLQLSGEFADPVTKRRLWDAAEEYIEPTWEESAGEFTFALGLNEAHPRGQWNARMMAGWVCTQGAWSRIFNQPNLAKFDEPTVEGVDFPKIVLSEARWDGAALYVAAHPQNASVEGIQTNIRVTNIQPGDWVATQSNGERVYLTSDGDHLDVPLVADNQVVVIQPR